jgi:hypothetical protein
MTIQTINLGNYANDGTGDDLRTAFEKVNANFSLLDAEAAINAGANLGSGTGIFAAKSAATLEFKSLTSVDNSVTITHDANTINLQATQSISVDTNPELGGNLNLNNHYVYGGDVQTTVYGFDIPSMFGLYSLLLSTNQINVDLGSFSSPSAGTIDLNGTGNLNFLDSATNQTELDFGTFV